MMIRRWFSTLKLILALVLACTVSAAVAPAAPSVDPLLLGLVREHAAKGNRGPQMSLERIIEVQESTDPSNPRISVILHLSGGLPEWGTVPGLRVGSVRNDIATARLPLSSLSRLTALAGIERIEASRRMRPLLDAAVPAGRVDEVWAGAPAYTGQGVLVGIVDSGLDWSHEDFQNADGTTRIQAIWDLYGTGTPPAGFDLGAEYDAADVEAGTVAQRDYSGHGTHVTGIAAGNGRASSGTYTGVAPESDILFAKAFSDAAGGFEGARVIDALNWLADKAAAMDRPLAINLSLGGHQGPHDGTTGQETVIDAISGPGVVVCVAAGNEGEMQIHDSAEAANGSLSLDIEEFYTPNSGTGDDYVILEIWVEEPTSVSVTTPGGTTYGPVASGTGDAGYSSPHGAIVIDNASTGVDPFNGDQVIYVQLDDQAGTDLAGGNWTIRFSGGSGTAHAWNVVSTMNSLFPDSDDTYSVATPGTSLGAITVAAWKTRNSWPSSVGTRLYGGTWGAVPTGGRAPFSSIGPTRSGQQKPDIAAPGMAIISTYSQDQTPAADAALVLTGYDYMANQGTSMASPYACGVAALLLQKNRGLTADEVKQALRSSAATDTYTGTTWNPRFGAGKIDALAALAAIAAGGGTPNGDLNLDGETTVLDIVLLVNHILDAIGNPLDAEAAANANVNGDGVIDVADLVRVVDFVMGIDTPGKSGFGPAHLVLDTPYFAEGRWWQDAHLRGGSLAAAQFALRTEGATWNASGAELLEPDAARLVAYAAGSDESQLRVVIYDLDNELPATLNLRLPLVNPVDVAPTVRSNGATAAGADGSHHELVVEKSHNGLALQLGLVPNPVTSATEIRFSAVAGRSYDLAVYDLRGRCVRKLQQGMGNAAPLAIGWDGTDTAGRRLSAGVYFLRLRTGQDVVTRKVVLER